MTKNIRSIRPASAAIAISLTSQNAPLALQPGEQLVADFNNAKVSLKDALAIAERQAGGGKAYEAEVEREGKAVAYEIKVALADKEQEVKVGPDGQVMKD